MISRILAFVFALNGTAWIDVPFTPQDENGCGSASVWMVMQYWRQAPPPVEEIQRVLYSPEAGGIFASDLTRYLTERSFQTFTFAGQWADLTQNVANGRPLIVCLRANSRGTPLHYVVVAGIQENPEAVLVNDPARRKLIPIDRKEFEKQWEATDRWTLLATPATPPVSITLTSAPSMTAPSGLEPATAAFRSANYPEAIRLARRTLKVAPEDPLINEFLGTVYYLNDNLEAALKYWNRVNRPLVYDVGQELQPIISRSTVLRSDDYFYARKRLDASGVFSRYIFDLKPTDSDDFDLSLRALERPKFRPLGWLRGLPYRTINPEVFNLGDRAINVETLLRWDPSRQRGFFRVSGPLTENLRYRGSFDYRNEDWNDVRVKKREVGAAIDGIVGSRGTWSSGVVAGTAFKYDGAVTYDWWRAPEFKLAASSALRTQVGQSSGRFARVETDTRLGWRSSRVRFRNGRVFGHPRLGEMFSLGLDRDHDLWVRAHRERLIGRRYILLNSEVEKRIFSWNLIDFKLAPFVDIARVSTTYVDSGVDARVAIGGLVSFSLTIGRDLKAGKTTVFTNLTR